MIVFIYNNLNMNNYFINFVYINLLKINGLNKIFYVYFNQIHLRYYII